jgi:hypothetical protein
VTTDFLPKLPRCRLRNPLDQNLTTGDFFAWGTNANQDSDIHTYNDIFGGNDTTPGLRMYDSTSSTTRINFRYTGLYLLCITMNCSTNTTGYRQIVFKVNGTTNIANSVVQAVGNSVNSTLPHVSAMYSATRGEYVEVQFLHNAGGTLLCAGDRTYFSATMLRGGF